MKIPCDTIARLANLTGGDEPIFSTIRLQDGMVIATDRRFMAVEHVGGFTGTAHIVVDPALIAQCENEAKFSSMLEITVNEPLAYTVGKTTLGYTSGNLYVPPTPSAFDKWLDVARICAEPATAPRGTMIWHVDGLVKLARTAPSGILSFEQVIDADTRPTVVRDINSPDWVGLFLPRIDDGQHHASASLPGWLK